MITALAIAILCLLFLIFRLGKSLIVAHRSHIQLAKATAHYAHVHKELEHGKVDSQLRALQKRVENWNSNLHSFKCRWRHTVSNP